MTPQKALNILYKGIAPNPTANNECIELCKKALEKQIPKKPTNYSIDNNGYMIFECECPTCKCSHREYYPFSYCNHCGQALDWGDYNE